MRLRQRVGPAEFNRVLRGDHEKELGQVPSFTVHAHLIFAHGFEQGGLGAGRSAVDFIGQQDVGEDRAFMERKILVALVENGDPENIRRQQVGSELDPLEAGVDGPGEGFGQSSLACARIIFEQHMTATG